MPKKFSLESFRGVPLRNIDRRERVIILYLMSLVAFVFAVSMASLALWSFRCDERRLKQVLYNLLSNAVKFTDVAGRVTLFAGLRSDGVKRWLDVVVTDTGPGIRTEDRERIFEAFEQVKRGDGAHIGGSGLGLSLSKAYVELHGGHIWADAGQSGIGSRFKFTIPDSIDEGQTGV